MQTAGSVDTDKKSVCIPAAKEVGVTEDPVYMTKNLCTAFGPGEEKARTTGVFGDVKPELMLDSICSHMENILVLIGGATKSGVGVEEVKCGEDHSDTDSWFDEGWLGRGEVACVAADVRWWTDLWMC